MNVITVTNDKFTYAVTGKRQYLGNVILIASSSERGSTTWVPIKTRVFEYQLNDY
jgi:hypothetical protein